MLQTPHNTCSLITIFTNHWWNMARIPLYWSPFQGNPTSISEIKGYALTATYLLMFMAPILTFVWIIYSKYRSKIFNATSNIIDSSQLKTTVGIPLSYWTYSYIIVNWDFPWNTTPIIAEQLPLSTRSLFTYIF